MPIVIAVYGGLIWVTCRLHGSERYRNRYAFFKLLTSLCFVAIALTAGYKAGFGSLSLFLLPGFWFAVAGDYLLGLAHAERNYKGKEFLLGVGAFILAHISFYLSYVAIAGFRWVDLLFPTLFASTMFFVLRGKNFLLGKMKIPGIVYSFFVALLASKGAVLFFSEGREIRFALVLCGGLFFLVSDIILLFMYFHVSSDKKRLGTANLMTYYIAMGLLAFSLYPF